MRAPRLVLLFLTLTLSRLPAGNAWLYQLQNPDPTSIAKSGFSLVVMDYSRNGSEEGEFSPADLSILIGKGKTVLAYFSIGEAEDYRLYWQDQWESAKRPAWLGRENPHWEGNYCVRYWIPEWREAVLRPYLQRIVAQGFSGVYLDIVDGFEYWGDSDTYGPDRETRLPGDPADEEEAARRMTDLIAWIQATATELRKNSEPFLIFAQNGERLLSFADAEKFRASITGLGVESLWFTPKGRQSAKETCERLPLLQIARQQGLQVIVTDYLDDGTGPLGENGERVREFIALCEKESFDHYAARNNQALNSINRIDGLQPNK